jgi:hypothetical protein
MVWVCLDFGKRFKVVVDEERKKSKARAGLYTQPPYSNPHQPKLHILVNKTFSVLRMDGGICRRFALLRQCDSPAKISSPILLVVFNFRERKST